MSGFLFIFITVMCFTLGVRVLNSEEQNKVFQKVKLPLEDVKQYNKYCGYLIIGFGAVADLTIFAAGMIGGVADKLSTLYLILEAVIVMKVYSKIEKKCIRKNK